jgi:hypothetical protein
VTGRIERKNGSVISTSLSGDSDGGAPSELQPMVNVPGSISENCPPLTVVKVGRTAVI